MSEKNKSIILTTEEWNQILMDDFQKEYFKNRNREVY